MHSKKRGGLLTVSLMTTLAATGHFWISERDIVEPTHNVLQEIPQTFQNLTYEPQVVLVNRSYVDPLTDIFSIHQQHVEEADVVTPVSPTVVETNLPPSVLPAPPVAPALPFTYIGKLIEENEIVVFLGSHGKNLVVKTGDIIQQTYRVEEIKPPLLTMTYLPMGIKQSIQIGEIN